MINKITLLELNKSIQETIKNSFSDSVWVISEISELKVNRNGHCYIELIEKDKVTDNIIAKTRATIWAFTYRMLKPYFESATGYELNPGIKVLIKASVEFHELYGFSLNITDIDPNYTIGDLAQKKIEIVNQLKEDGVFEMNKETDFPIVPQKIAVISSETAAGYQDFVNQLDNNNFDFKFYHKLFPSVMQGMQAEESIINSLEEIYKHEDKFDIVVLIRGGGSQADLNCFDSYLLASNIAQFPLPVLTGIGHDKDESVTDLVAHKKLKTPTAVAEYIIEATASFNNILEDYTINLADLVNSILSTEKLNINHYSTLSIPLVKAAIEKNKSELNIYSEKAKRTTDKKIYTERIELTNKLKALKAHSVNKIRENQKTTKNLTSVIKKDITHLIIKNKLSLNTLETKIDLINPETILKKGYSITFFKNKRLTDQNQVKENDTINTQLFNGFVRSTVKGKTSKNS